MRRLHGALEDYLRELHVRFAELDLTRPPGAARLRQRRHLPRRARDLPPARRRGRRARRPARRPQHQRRLRLDAPRASRRRRWHAGDHDLAFAFDGDGDRVLAVDRNGVVVDGDELVALAAIHLRERGHACRRRRGRDGDDELRLSHGDGRRTACRSRRPRSATATCSTSCASAAGRSAASSPATSSTSASGPRATGSRARC